VLTLSTHTNFTSQSNSPQSVPNLKRTRTAVVFKCRPQRTIRHHSLAATTIMSQPRVSSRWTPAQALRKHAVNTCAYFAAAYRVEPFSEDEDEDESEGNTKPSTARSLINDGGSAVGRTIPLVTSNGHLRPNRAGERAGARVIPCKRIDLSAT
jgi:hypothetical protein